MYLSSKLNTQIEIYLLQSGYSILCQPFLFKNIHNHILFTLLAVQQIKTHNWIFFNNIETLSSDSWESYTNIWLNATTNSKIRFDLSHIRYSKNCHCKNGSLKYYIFQLFSLQKKNISSKYRIQWFCNLFNIINIA